jgi:uncharacterized sporulation protein YeaH/YhbH (DUF444 family)
MAEKLNSGDGGGKRGRGKAKTDGPGMGHNITQIRKEAEPIFKRLANKQRDMETAMGEFRVDLKNLYEEGANKIGCSRKVLREEFRRYIYNLKAEQRELELEASERAEIEALRAALEGTPFGSYVAGTLAEPKTAG